MKFDGQNRYKGGVIASRNNPKCYRRQEEIRINNKLSFLRKSLSLKAAYFLSGISKNVKNLLIIGTSGDIATSD